MTTNTITLKDRENSSRTYDYYNKYNDSNRENLNETIVTLRLTKKHYRTAYTLAHILGHKSLDDFVSYIVVRNIEMYVDGGEIDIDRKELL